MDTLLSYTHIVSGAGAVALIVKHLLMSHTGLGSTIVTGLAVGTALAHGYLGVSTKGQTVFVGNGNGRDFSLQNLESNS